MKEVARRAAETLEVRLVPCVCGKGAISVKVKIGRKGPVVFRVDEPAPCPACGSSDVKAAEAMQARADEARTVRTTTVPCRCGQGEITLTMTEGHRGAMKYRAEGRPLPCPTCGSADITDAPR